jgi:6-phosphogluconolactonase
MGNDLFAFVGTYTRLGSEGVYTLRMNGDTGELTKVSAASGIENPSFVALDPSNEHLYAVGEVSSFDGAGAVTSFSVNSVTGELTQINQQSTGGPGPCHLMVDSTDSLVIATNYSPISSSTKALRLTPAARKRHTHTRSTSTSRTRTPTCATSAWTRCLSTTSTTRTEN